MSNFLNFVGTTTTTRSWKVWSVPRPRWRYGKNEQEFRMNEWTEEEDDDNDVKFIIRTVFIPFLLYPNFLKVKLDYSRYKCSPQRENRQMRQFHSSTTFFLSGHLTFVSAAFLAYLMFESWCVQFVCWQQDKAHLLFPKMQYMRIWIVIRKGAYMRVMSIMTTFFLLTLVSLFFLPMRMDMRLYLSSYKKRPEASTTASVVGISQRKKDE